MEPKYLNDPDKWILAEDIPNCDSFLLQIALSCFVNTFDKTTGVKYKKVLCKYEGYHLWFYYGEEDSFSVAEKVVDRIVDEPGFAKAIDENILLEADKLRSFAATLPQENLSALSNEELANIYEHHHAVHQENYTWFWIPNAIDMFHTNLTNRLKQYLRTKNILEDELVQYFVTLTQPTKESVIFIEQQDLLRIGVEIEKDPQFVELFQTQSVAEIKAQLPDAIRILLEKHWDEYHYTKFIFVAGEFTLEDYIHQLQEIFKNNLIPSEIITNQKRELEKKAEEREILLEQLQITGQWREIFDAFGDYMVSKMYRRFAQLFVLHRMDKIIKETARRFFITPMQIRFMLPSEITTMLREGIYDEQELQKRTKKCVYYAEEGFETMVTGTKAEELMNQVDETVDHSLTELKGQTGNPGYGKGMVKIIIRAEDMVKMNEGDVLVSISTDPDIVPAMKKAAAIVTEQGGVTSHATIVSRELGIPCIIGTKIATKVLKDGDMVEVDANKGIVRIIQ